MIDKNISVHLQDFPDVSFLSEERDLVADMDLVRALCSMVLSIRDNKNLRVRLPLNKIIVIGKNSSRILPFVEIIADEVNVKSVETKEEISDLAELKLQINFKKIGAKYGSKMKEITEAMKGGEWKKLSEKEVEIAGIKLLDDEFEIKLSTTIQDEKKFVTLPLPSNDYLVQLDIEISKDLEDEGLARDIVRAIQQNRKDANLNISDHINLKIFSENPRSLEVTKSFEKYIKEQVLGDALTYASDEESVKNSAKFFFKNTLEDGIMIVGF